MKKKLKKPKNQKNQEIHVSNAQMNINQYVELMEKHTRMNVYVLVMVNVESIEKENVILFINALIVWVYWIEYVVKMVSHTTIDVIYSV